MNNKLTLDSLLEGLKAYQNIANKKLHYIYSINNTYREISLVAQTFNFMHLCGVKYTDPVNKQIVKPNHFYNALKANRISLKGIHKLPSGATDQKLQVIRYIDQLATCSVRIVDEGGSYLNLRFDKAIRTRRQTFCVTLIFTSTGTYRPNSLLNLRSNKSSTIGSGYPVHCIYTVDPHDKAIRFVCKTNEFVEYEKRKEYIYQC